MHGEHPRGLQKREFSHEISNSLDSPKFSNFCQHFCINLESVFIGIIPFNYPFSVCHVQYSFLQRFQPSLVNGGGGGDVMGDAHVKLVVETEDEDGKGSSITP